MNPPRYTISLRLFSPSIHPDAMEAAIGLPPKVRHVMGERRKSPKGLELDGTYPENYCSFRLVSRSDELLRDAVERLTTDMSSQQLFLSTVSSTGGRAELFIGWMSTRNTGETLNHELLSKLALLSLDLSLDVYCDESER